MHSPTSFPLRRQGDRVRVCQRGPEEADQFAGARHHGDGGAFSVPDQMAIPPVEPELCLPDDGLQCLPPRSLAGSRDPESPRQPRLAIALLYGTNTPGTARQINKPTESSRRYGRTGVTDDSSGPTERSHDIPEGLAFRFERHQRMEPRHRASLRNTLPTIGLSSAPQNSMCGLFPTPRSTLCQPRLLPPHGTSRLLTYKMEGPAASSAPS
jgi:hypothetical protein